MQTYGQNSYEKCFDRDLTDHKRILVNFAYINATSEDFLYDILCFMLKQYVIQKVGNVRDLLIFKSLDNIINFN